MSDYAHRATDEALADLEKRISQVYADASNEMQGTVTEYFKQFAARDREQAAALEAGEITEREYKQWRLTQLSRGEKYKTMQSSLAERYVKADEVAVSYVNDATPGIYSLNRNYSAYTIEQAGADVSFTLYDESTVRRLIKEQPNLMPNYPAARAVRRGIDLAYGKRQITASITSGILQGKDIYKIANDLMSRISTMSEESAVRTARTAFTAAENAGRQDSYEEAEAMGIPMQKRWVATLDDRTRESHIEADGQTVGVDENFKVGDDELEYPGDPGGEPCEIYNCRCTVIAVVGGNEYKDAERRGDGERFEEWLEEHGLTEGINSVADCKDINDLTKYMQESYDIYVASGVKDLDFESVKEVLTGCETMFRDYPALAETINGIQTDNHGVMCCDGNTIAFNPSYFRNHERLERTCQMQFRAGHWSADTPASIGVHECAHGLERVLINNNPAYESNYLLRVDAWNNCTEAKNIVSQAAKNVKKTAYGKGKKVAELKESISSYATENASETMAEAMADVYSNGKDANPLSTEIAKLLKEQYSSYTKG